jgi:tripartite-type tricarboxylate transporter receptor subunit TctC
MSLSRRHFLRLSASLATLAAPQRSWAQPYPNRPVRIIVGFAPGAGTDISARLIAQWLSKRLGQQFIVENRPGAGSNIAIDTVAKAQADGYTLLLVSPAAAINATLYDKLNYSFVRDLAPVAGISRAPNLMVTNLSIPVKTVPEFIGYAKANSGKINMASAGNGTTAHLTGELFKMMSGIPMVHVPYRGSGPAIIDLIAGRVQVAFDPLPSSIEHVRARKLQALAVTTATRSDALPGIPTVGEFLPGFEASAWYGIAAPSNAPVEIINVLNKEINAALADTQMNARLAEMGSTALPGSPADFGRLITEETQKWGKVIRVAGIKPD